MDNLSHVQIENTQKKKEDKKCVIFYSAEGEGQEKYMTVKNAEEAFVHIVGLKQKGVTNIKVFQEIQLKIQTA